jgi:hypothetical protein
MCAAAVTQGCGDTFVRPSGAPARLVVLGGNSLWFLGDGGTREAMVSLHAGQLGWGERAVSVSDDGTLVVACGYNGLFLFGPSGELGAHIPMSVRAACPAANGIYTLAAQLLCGDTLVVFDRDGVRVDAVAVAGSDLVVDGERGAVWVAGCEITKYNLDLSVQWTIAPLSGRAASLDVAPDGGIWIAESKWPSEVGENRLLKVGEAGDVDGEIPLDPVLLPGSLPATVRVDRVTGRIWIASTFDGGVFLFDPGGSLVATIENVGWSLAIERRDGSVWVNGREGLCHYSRDAALLEAAVGGEVGGTIALFPE